MVASPVLDRNRHRKKCGEDDRDGRGTDPAEDQRADNDRRAAEQQHPARDRPIGVTRVHDGSTEVTEDERNRHDRNRGLDADKVSKDRRHEDAAGHAGGAVQHARQECAHANRYERYHLESEH